jgi:hypothetical protein
LTDEFFPLVPLIPARVSHVGDSGVMCHLQ